MSKSVAIIGAGVAGLSTAIRLKKDGYKVTIFEKNPQVGGKMYQLCKDGYKFDVGPTIIMMPEVYRDVFRYAGVDPDDYIPMQQLEPIYTVQFGNKIYDVNTNIAGLTGFLEEVAPKDVVGYYQYLSKTYKKFLVARDHFIQRPYRKLSDLISPKALFHLLKLKTFNNAYNEIAKYVKSDILRKLLSFQTLYIGISPHNGPSIYTIIPMIETVYGVWYMEGGMYRMAQQMERLYRELGGELKLNSTVEEIWIEEKQAKGIMVNGEKLAFDYVVNDSDFPYAMNNLIKDEKKKGKYTTKKIDSMDYSCSVFMMYLGVNRKLNNIKLHNIIFADDFEKNISDIFAGNEPDDPSIYLYSPSRIDPELAPEGKDLLYVLVPVPELKTRDAEWTESDRKEYRKVIMEKIRLRIPDIDDIIESETIFTPHDFEELFNACHGATFGLAPTLLQSNFFRPHNKFKAVDNLYFCGSSVHPGAGVPIVLTSAVLAAEELKKDDRS